MLSQFVGPIILVTMLEKDIEQVRPEDVFAVHLCIGLK